MKYILFLLLLIGKIHSYAQGLSIPGATQPSTAINLLVTHNKTTLIVFPVSIKSGDVGQEVVSAQLIRGTNNILRVKAVGKAFEPTNLNVVTADGKVYTFNIFYSDQATCMPVYVDQPAKKIAAMFPGTLLNENQIEEFSKAVHGLPSSKYKRSRNYGIELSLQGVFIKGEIVFFKYRLHNCTNLGYKFDSFRFFVRDMKTAKRTAIQDIEMHPLFVRSFCEIESSAGQSLIVAFPRFSIADSKHFIAEIMEKGGDRNLKLGLKQKVLLRAKPF